jgi:hypothetical protein
MAIRSSQKTHGLFISSKEQAGNSWREVIAVFFSSENPAESANHCTGKNYNFLMVSQVVDVVTTVL